MSEWLVPFARRNASGAYNQNFLWRDGNTYVMDNHRAALWCWLQHITPGERLSLLHIDCHTDTKSISIAADCCRPGSRGPK